MKKKDIWLIGILLCLAAALFFIARPAPVTQMPKASMLPSETGESTANAAAPDPGGDALPEAYLLISVRGQQYEPIPLDRETEFTLRQKDTGAENTIHVTTGSMYMSCSTCENQDCVEQGTVSLENRNTRLLQNMIICLPNKVTLELLTASEVEQLAIAAE